MLARQTPLTRSAYFKKLVDARGESANIANAPTHGDIAQLGERVTGSHEVRGSNPLISTMKLLAAASVAAFFITGSWRNG